MFPQYSATSLHDSSWAWTLFFQWGSDMYRGHPWMFAGIWSVPVTAATCHICQTTTFYIGNGNSLYLFCCFCYWEVCDVVILETWETHCHFTLSTCCKLQVVIVPLKRPCDWPVSCMNILLSLQLAVLDTSFRPLLGLGIPGGWAPWLRYVRFPKRSVSLFLYNAEHTDKKIRVCNFVTWGNFKKAGPVYGSFLLKIGSGNSD